MRQEADIRVRFDETGGGATLTIDGEPETYTYALGIAVSRFGSLAFLGGDSGMDGGEELYRERLRAELLAQIKRHGVRQALFNVFGISDDEMK